MAGARARAAQPAQSDRRPTLEPRENHSWREFTCERSSVASFANSPTPNDSSQSGVLFFARTQTSGAICYYNTFYFILTRILYRAPDLDGRPTRSRSQVAERGRAAARRPFIIYGFAGAFNCAAAASDFPKWRARAASRPADHGRRRLALQACVRVMMMNGADRAPIASRRRAARARQIAAVIAPSRPVSAGRQSKFVTPPANLYSLGRPIFVESGGSSARALKRARNWVARA